jgi:hypothetical protein
MCAHFRVTPVSRGSSEWTPKAALEVINADMRRLLADMKKLPDFQLPGTPKPPRSAKILPGDRACPSGCTGGELLLVDNWTDCKTCSGGKFACTFCTRGLVRCDPCKGKGKLVKPCDDCAGTGQLRDSAAFAATVCPWCLGAQERECGSCKDKSETTRVCLTCWGTSEIACEYCKGFGVCPCPKCGGRGRTGMRKEKCDRCATRGAWDCRDCKKGHRSCRDCSRETQLRACIDCEGEGKHACNGCSVGAYIAWEQTAALERARGSEARASALLQIARDRCEARYAAVKSSVAKVQDNALVRDIDAAVQKEREAELRRIDALIAAGKTAENRAGKDGVEVR